ncbi:hypothetical protein Scep_007669 [Stephania cephalantha]|uniref:Uncharacterized protein n=1 Tax=Stephania cephalantha TaxID=152367 RepID=A0AAP0PM05_9MAGN
MARKQIAAGGGRRQQRQRRYIYKERERERDGGEEAKGGAVRRPRVATHGGGGGQLGQRKWGEKMRFWFLFGFSNEIEPVAKPLPIQISNELPISSLCHY